MLIDNFCPKSNSLNLCTLDIAVHWWHWCATRGTNAPAPATRALFIFIFFSKLPLLFPVREWNSRVWWWNYGIDSQIETFSFQHWKKFRNVNVQLQTNVDLWLNEKLIDFANAMIFQKTSRTLYEKNKELHVWKIFEKKGPAIRSIFSFFPDFFVRPILNSKKNICGFSFPFPEFQFFPSNWIFFWQRGADCIMSSTNADLIAVSLVCTKDSKSPFRMGPPRVSSVWNLLEKVGCLTGIVL